MENERANPLIFALVCCFASCSWLGANSIWVELTVFTQTQPEGWKLGSVLDVVIQLASVGAIVFMILDRGLKLPIPHAVVIQLSLVVCALGNLPLAFRVEGDRVDLRELPLGGHSGHRLRASE
ncbi:hypothetical protein M3Y99_00783500 [Aphelenchoides fujianensis]|nr:hypothetical protein M3Y99_00783500 [Aphelenchoides fujianensis]